MSVQVSCSESSLAVLKKVREALSVIYSVHLICHSKDFWETGDTFDFLGEWFCKNFELETLPDSEILKGFNTMRDWSWWDVRILKPNQLTVYIKVSGFPISGFDCLRWLLQTCGASHVEQGPSLVPSEIPSTVTHIK